MYHRYAKPSEEGQSNTLITQHYQYMTDNNVIELQIGNSHYHFRLSLAVAH